MNPDPNSGPYDAVVVGAGMAGSIVALELGRAGKRVLVLDSGPRSEQSRAAFQEQSLTEWIRGPEAPYPPYGLDPSSQMTPRATVAAYGKWPVLGLDPPNRAQAVAAVNAESYLTYDPASELPFLSGYERLVGGTMWHWLGTCVRLVPNDFCTQTAYGWGQDWLVNYDDLVPYYEKAEAEIGVAGDVDQQAYCGITFRPGYQYPMRPIPSSYSDDTLAKGVEGYQWDEIPVTIVNTPQGRNSRFNEGRPACEGNSSCVPLCPIQAKYDATVTLRKAEATGNVQVFASAVATRLCVDGETSRISDVEYCLVNPDGSAGPTQSVSGTLVIIAAHAIETPKLLLQSRTDQLPRGVANQSSDQVGRNLMDHICYLGWGLSTKPNYPMRGPRSTSGIEHLRDGPFRSHRAAFRVDIGNEGWSWADHDPYTLVTDFIDGANVSKLNPDSGRMYGTKLVRALNNYLTRMVRFCFLVEQTPEANNRITLSETFRDGLGLARPLINYGVSCYTKRGFVAAAKATSDIFEAAGIKNYTRFVNLPGFPAFEFEDDDGNPLRFNGAGAGHIMGTYRMGLQGEGVVNAASRSWDHPNLYLLGSGTFPTVGTGNPTLTIVALSFLSTEAMLRDLA